MTRTIVLDNDVVRCDSLKQPNKDMASVVLNLIYKSEKGKVLRKHRLVKKRHPHFY